MDMECSAVAALAKFRGVDICHFFYAADHLSEGNWDARKQGGVSVDDVKVTDIAKTCTAADFEKGHVIIKKGKKVFHKVVLK